MPGFVTENIAIDRRRIKLELTDQVAYCYRLATCGGVINYRNRGKIGTQGTSAMARSQGDDRTEEKN